MDTHLVPRWRETHGDLNIKSNNLTVHYALRANSIGRPVDQMRGFPWGMGFRRPLRTSGDRQLRSSTKASEPLTTVYGIVVHIVSWWDSGAFFQKYGKGAIACR